MLKWLRKYNGIILVVGGVLLMIAFLLPQTIQELGRHPLGGAPMKIDGRRVSWDAHDYARREYYAVRQLVGEAMAGRLGAGENFEHWILLNREAERFGFEAGKGDGREFLPEIARSAVSAQYEQFRQFMNPQDIAQRIETESKQLTDNLVNNGVPQVMELTHLTEDQVYRALGKLHSIARMRATYFNSAAGRFSGPRLIRGMKGLMDSVQLDAVFVPADRELANVPEPTAEQVEAQFEKYKGVRPGEGEYGVGYLLPERVKIAYMTIDQQAIESSIKPDAVEVRKRFLKQFPTGTPPDGETAAAATARIEQEVRSEELGKVMRAIDQSVKAEIEKSTRRLEPDGAYRALPENWDQVRPEFAKMRDTLVTRVREMTGTTIPTPAVTVRDAQWLTRKDLGELSGIGGSQLKRGNQSEGFVDFVLRVREIAGPNDAALQTRVPHMEYTIDLTNVRYYFTVLDARKESAPDSVDEVREQVKADVKRIAAFERLKSQMGAFRLLVETSTNGLSAVAAVGSGPDAPELPIKTGLRIQGETMSPPDADLNREAFRKGALEAAEKLDALKDVATQEISKRTIVVALPKSLGVGVGLINGVSPLTEEMFRRADASRVAAEMVRRQGVFIEGDPFSLKRMEARMNVKYTDDRKTEEEKSGGKDGTTKS